MISFLILGAGTYLFEENAGLPVLLSGLLISFLGTAVMAIPSVSFLRSFSVRHKFNRCIEPALTKLKNGESIDEGTTGFHLIVYYLESALESELGCPDQISPTGRYLITNLWVDDNNVPPESVDLIAGACAQSNNKKLQYGYRTLLKGFDLEKGQHGFSEIVGILEEASGKEFDSPEVIRVHGEWLITGLAIDERVVTGDLESVDLTMENLTEELEVTCQTTGLKILCAGFFVQIMGTLIMNVTVTNVF